MLRIQLTHSRNFLTTQGELDFDTIPSPPLDVPKEFIADNGTVMGPEPLNESWRQRTVAALNLAGPDSDYKTTSEALRQPLTDLINEARARFGTHAGGVNVSSEHPFFSVYFCPLSYLTLVNVTHGY